MSEAQATTLSPAPAPRTTPFHFFQPPLTIKDQGMACTHLTRFEAESLARWLNGQLAETSDDKTLWITMPYTKRPVDTTITYHDNVVDLEEKRRIPPSHKRILKMLSSAARSRVPPTRQPPTPAAGASLRHRFIPVSIPRMKAILKALHALGEMAGPRYGYTDAEVDQMEEAVMSKAAEVFDALRRRRPMEPEFEFRGQGKE